MKKTIKIGVIGCGEIAQIMHLPYLAELDEFELWSLCNTSKKPLAFCTEKYGVPKERCYTDFADLIADPALDAVLICSADHYQPAMAAIAHGKHLFIEKPLAFNEAQAQAIVDGAKEKQLVLQVGYMKVYDPAFRFFAEKVASMKEITHVGVHNFCGDFGFMKEIYPMCKVSDITPEQQAARDKARNEAVAAQIGTDDAYFAGPYMDLLLGTSHDTVLLRKLFGDLQVRYGDVDGSGTVLATLETASGLRIAFEEGYIDQRSVWDETISVWGPECRAVLEFPSPYLRNAPTLVHLNENDPGGANREQIIQVSYEESFRCEWKAFAQSIFTGAVPESDGQGAVEDIRIASDIIRKAMLNR